MGTTRPGKVSIPQHFTRGYYSSVEVSISERTFLRLVSKEADCDRFAKDRNPRHRPYAFTEHGAIMAANVLNGPRAVQMSVFVVRAFVRLRQLIASHRDIVVKRAELERKVATHDAHIRSLFDAIRQLMTPPETKQRKIGFMVKGKCGEIPEASSRLTAFRFQLSGFILSKDVKASPGEFALEPLNLELGTLNRRKALDVLK